MSLTYDVDSSQPNVTQQNIENAVGNLYKYSPTFRKVMDYINGHSSNPEVRVVVNDTDVEPIMYTRGDASSPSPWPYGSADYVIVVPTTFFDGDTIPYGMGDPVDVTFDDIPVWMFQGEQDTTASAAIARQVAAAMHERGRPVFYTEYPRQGHGAWVRAYEDADFWSWLFQQRRS